jgi:hypothetical protein
MKLVYPILLTPADDGLLVFIPDLDINTHDTNLSNAIEMARDAISLWCVCQEDEGISMPHASELSTIKCEVGEIATLVDVDTRAYRRGLDSSAFAMAAGA